MLHKMHQNYWLGLRAVTVAVLENEIADTFIKIFCILLKYLLPIAAAAVGLFYKMLNHNPHFSYL